MGLSTYHYTLFNDGIRPMKQLLLSILAGLLLSANVLAADNVLKTDHPDQYTVQEGDTLWDIASMFLVDAWLWPEIWQVNPDIENPHLIFPGDLILLRYVDGQPQLRVARGDVSRTIKVSPSQPIRQGDRNQKLMPQVRSSPLASAIPAIPLDAIASLLTTGRIVEEDTLENAPYILAGESDRLIFGPGDGFYGRGTWERGTSVYGIFRGGQVYKDPVSKEILGYEALEVGIATLDELGENDVATFTMSSVSEDVRLGDRLLPTEERRVESTFYPSAPEREVDGTIMTVIGGVTQVGRNDVVAINKGASHGLEAGNVLAIYKSGAVIRDRNRRDKVKLPDQRAGILMVFRSFEKMSYCLVLNTDTPLRVGDTVKNP
jgi:nucleoid-associated protein YgaU